jgi:hypothetical protein
MNLKNLLLSPLSICGCRIEKIGVKKTENLRNRRI